MKKHKFQAQILTNDKGGAFVEIPFDVEKEMGAKRPKIKALFEGKQSYQGSLVRMGTDCHLLIVRKDVRTVLKKEIGDQIQVEVWLDTEPRTVKVPSQLKEAFKTETNAQKFYKSLSYTCQKEYANYITEAKKEATRERRTSKVIDMLNKGIKTLS